MVGTSVMSQRVLVTGGLGFVGSALVEHLLDNGHDVTVFDDASRGTVENVDQHRVEICLGDLGDQDAFSRCLRAHPYAAVVHLAAMHFIPDCNRDPQACIATNVIGTENVIAACDEHDVERLIAASSMAVYPISDGACSEEDPVGPCDVYGETKVSNEMQLLRWSRGGGARVAVALRLSNAYGPRETNPHVIPEIMRQLARGVSDLKLGNTAPLRDYVHVDDVATAFVALLGAPLDPGYHVFNVGSGEERSVDQILKLLSGLLGRDIEVRFDPSRIRPVERMHLLADVGRLTASTGWRPEVAFEQGLAGLCQWYGLLGSDDDGDGEL